MPRPAARRRSAAAFTTVGTYSFDLSGGWRSEVHYGYSNESAWRNCYCLDPDNGGDLYCDSWNWQYSDANDWYSNEGNLWGGSISIEVVPAAMPEPGSWALMLAPEVSNSGCLTGPPCALRAPG